MIMANALIVGASRGIGLGLVREFLARGWSVTATVRGDPGSGELQKMAQTSDGKLRIETADTADVASGEALRGRLAGEAFDLVLVNAGVGGPAGKNPRTVSRDEFADLMVTNALGPVRLAELLSKQVRPQSGVVAVMTSQLGSVANNTTGGTELYRASKAALNSLARSFAARHRDKGLAVLALHPGWVRTDMGGPNAAIDVETSAKGIANVVERAQGDRRSGFFDYKGDELPW
jgi:NAD(P)-dependent dehydrogenase (short-subunit alcohol dehydrogenase family)